MGVKDCILDGGVSQWHSASLTHLGPVLNPCVYYEKKRYFYVLRRVKASHSKTTMNHTKERKTCQNSSDVWNMNFHSLERSHFNLNTSEKMKIQQYDLQAPQKPSPSPTTFFLRQKVPLLTNLPDPDDELQARERSHPKGEGHFWGWQLMLSKFFNNVLSYITLESTWQD